MMLNLELNELAEHVGILLSESRRVEMECALQAELNSIEAYPDAIEAVAMLRERGVALVISSNLAQALWRGGGAAFPEHEYPRIQLRDRRFQTRSSYLPGRTGEA
ncbi:hypothetical protein J3P95_07805 [Pseudomonas sp. Z5-35]|uniref:hypothetical protein n=1 Tax=unclassified Pseudomonas TaxID=196821 RepID=UPI003DA7FE63